MNCAKCGKRIPKGRIKALPNTRVCTEHSNEDKYFANQIVLNDEEYTEMQFIKNQETINELNRLRNLKIE